MIGRPWIPPLGTVLIIAISCVGIAAAMQRVASSAPDAVVASIPTEPDERRDPAIAGAERVVARLDPVVLTRPLFQSDRRPWQPPPEPEAAVRPAPELRVIATPEPTPQPVLVAAPKLTLKGVMSDGTNPRALLAEPGRSGEWLSPGDVVSGWALTRIGARSVTLSHAAQEITLELDRQ